MSGSAAARAAFAAWGSRLCLLLGYNCRAGCQQLSQRAYFFCHMIAHTAIVCPARSRAWPFSFTHYRMIEPADDLLVIGCYEGHNNR